MSDDNLCIKCHKYPRLGCKDNDHKVCIHCFLEGIEEKTILFKIQLAESEPMDSFPGIDDFININPDKLTFNNAIVPPGVLDDIFRLLRIETIGVAFVSGCFVIKVDESLPPDTVICLNNKDFVKLINLEVEAAKEGIERSKRIRDAMKQL